MTPMFFGFRERELILSVFEAITGLRMNHAYIRPGGLAADLPDDGPARVRELLKILPGRLRELEDLLTESYIWKARTQGVGYLDLTGCMALGITGAVLRSTGLPHDLRKSAPYCGYETYDFDVITDDRGGLLRPLPDPHRRDARVAEDRRAVPRAPRAGPGDDRRQEAGLAGRSATRTRRPRQLPGPHRAHHGQVHGRPDPPLQDRHRGVPGAGRSGVHRGGVAARRTRRAHGLRRRHPPVPGALPRSQLHQSCRRWRRCARAAWSPT